MFYEFNQNNSGGRFVVNDSLCNRLFIEADDKDEAISKAEELGCYWDGVAEGIDCPCCGDRWSNYFLKGIGEDDRIFKEYSVDVYSGYKDAVSKWYDRYGKYEIVEKPHLTKGYSVDFYTGKIKFKNIEEYAQFLADEYGWTTPDVRIFYKDGTVKEIFKTEER